MLFDGSNPFAGGRASPRRQMGQPTQPVAQPPQYAAPTWPDATPDGNYAQGLAGHYANQLQNQQVPGSAPAPAQVPAASPTPAPAPAPAPVAGLGGHQHGGFDFTHMFGNQPGFAHMFGNQSPGQPAWLSPYMSALNGWMANRRDDPNSLTSWLNSMPQMSAFGGGS